MDHGTYIISAIYHTSYLGNKTAKSQGYTRTKVRCYQDPSLLHDPSVCYSNRANIVSLSVRSLVVSK